MKYYLDYLNTNNLGAIEYAPASPEMAASFFAPNLKLVVFEKCFVHDKWDKWHLAGELKVRNGRGCAINTLRFLNIINEEKQIDLLDQTTPISFTPFDEIIRLTTGTASAPDNTRIIERQFDISTEAQADAFLEKLDNAMPANTCVIVRFNSPPFEYHGAKTEHPVILHPGHVVVIAKDTRGNMYYVDVLYNQIIHFVDTQIFTDLKKRYPSISLMFKVVVPGQSTKGGKRRGHHRRHTKKRKSHQRTKRHNLYPTAHY